MPEINEKGFEKKPQSLKKADSKKSHGEQLQTSALKPELFGDKRGGASEMGPRVKVKKKLPIAIDIISGLCMLILVCAVIVGTYMMFRYYSNDYDGIEITYTAEISPKDQDLAHYMAMKNEEFFMDKDSNAIYFGKIMAVEPAADTGNIRITVKADAKYRSGEGYSIYDTKIAVGSRFTLRCGESREDVLVVELSGGK